MQLSVSYNSDLYHQFSDTDNNFNFNFKLLNQVLYINNNDSSYGFVVMEVCLLSRGNFISLNCISSTSNGIVSNEIVLDTINGYLYINPLSFNGYTKGDRPIPIKIKKETVIQIRDNLFDNIFCKHYEISGKHWFVSDSDVLYVKYGDVLLPIKIDTIKKFANISELKTGDLHCDMDHYSIMVKPEGFVWIPLNGNLIFITKAIKHLIGKRFRK